MVRSNPDYRKSSEVCKEIAETGVLAEKNCKLQLDKSAALIDISEIGKRKFTKLRVICKPEGFTIPTYNKLPTGLDLFNRLSGKPPIESASGCKYSWLVNWLFNISSINSNVKILVSSRKFHRLGILSQINKLFVILLLWLSIHPYALYAMTYQCLHVKAAQIAIDDQLFHEV